MSWTKLTLSSEQAHRIYHTHVPVRDDDTASFMIIELEEWLEEWCKANCKGRVKIRSKVGLVEPDGLTGGRARRFRVHELKIMYIKFKLPDDAMIFRLTL